MKIKSLGRNGQCPICRGTGKIQTTDWLTKGLSEEELAREKEEALADIVEVVRCRDCKYLIDDEDVHGLCIKIDQFYPPKNHSCSYGERREK